jgi:hypothetical protein
MVHNCADCALDLLATAGILLLWDISMSVNLLNTAALTLASAFGDDAVNGLNEILSAGGGGYTVPISVYYDYLAASGYSYGPPTLITLG